MPTRERLMRFVMMALLLSWTLTAAGTEMWRWVDERRRGAFL
jgi:hypothetical protein